MDDRHDQASFERFYRRHRSELDRFVRRRVSNRDVAEDVVADTWYAVAAGLAAGQRDENEICTPGWLYTVARRRLVDHWRRSDRRDRLERRVAADPSFDLVVSNPEPESLRGLLGRVPCSQADALRLRYVDGLAVADVASRLGLSYRATESLLARGRRSLRRAVRCEHDGAVVPAIERRAS